MDCIRKIRQTFKDMFTSACKPHNDIAILSASYVLFGCNAYMAILSKSLSCCTKYTPQYFVFFGPIHIWLFVLIIRHGYRELREVFWDWKSEEAQEIRSQKSEDASKNTSSEADESSEGAESTNGGKSKRRNHRGGAKAKKVKGKGGEAGATHR
ncbi:hypothetical protein OCU04_005005 [Sclerotinia nivalis]|uniref:Uncharacterized protein n=1 Tax=Sclerotinia nivalis TaxID=352851 RepID=A0A9X0AP17_9HELO|nr:hypothetical protein OCU04_005005 [Sclerotinia nivalis]